MFKKMIEFSDLPDHLINAIFELSDRPERCALASLNSRLYRLERAASLNAGVDARLDVDNESCESVTSFAHWIARHAWGLRDIGITIRGVPVHYQTEAYLEDVTSAFSMLGGGISFCTRLESLTLNVTALECICIDPFLPSLRGLESLVIAGKTFYTERGIGELTELTRLCISDGFRQDGHDQSDDEHEGNVESFVLPPGLRDIDTLKHLSIKGLEMYTCICSVENLTQLTYLQLVGKPGGDLCIESDLEVLSNLAMLQHLELSLDPSVVCDFGVLAGLTQLRHLDLWSVCPSGGSWTLQPAIYHSVDYADLAASVDALPRLEYFRHPDSTTARIRSNSITVLALSDFTISHSGALQLSMFTALERVVVRPVAQYHYPTQEASDRVLSILDADHNDITVELYSPYPTPDVGEVNVWMGIASALTKNNCRIQWVL
jgi:hypothetical protein